MITFAEGHRVFVDVTMGGCPCRCKYCFVNQGPDTPIDEAEIQRIVPRLLSQPGFHAGRKGTIIAFGSHADLFRTPRLASVFLAALDQVSRLENPVQVSTKHPVRPEWARSIQESSCYLNQIVVFVSCPTLWSSANFEPGCPPPEQRLPTIEVLREEGLASCLHIMPFLPGVTDREAEGFCAVLRNFHPNAYCVGALFADAVTRRRLNLGIEPRLDDGLRHPLFHQVDTAIRPSPEFVGALRTAAPEIPSFNSSVCALAALQLRPCHLHSLDGCPSAAVATHETR